MTEKTEKTQPEAPTGAEILAAAEVKRAAEPAVQPETKDEPEPDTAEPALDINTFDAPEDFDQDATGNVLIEVVKERIAQHNKWGVQTLPWGGGSEYWKRQARIATEETDKNAGLGVLSYLAVLKEEVFEAFAESDESIGNVRAELVQVAAVAVAAVESIDRNLAAAA